ncbi:hypothetical protein N7481_006364 [Penicillium waksmanii]|uniref:uncharacterized protein n=1 Tax=Penicillium waksmanii TaxID=69791 RepID=UPI002546D141|nr:uncharacterized protein N7481_006364 [Penicillium waksmanii]KAJ5984265.1 hypothetical protein N7481_006364 [Penicillium waksmanii]
MANYPRPDFQRKALNWASLDGTWSFIFDDKDKGLTQQWQKTGIPDQAAEAASPASPAQNKRDIKVPYAFQTPASGIGLYEAHEVTWYERSISDIRSADEVANGNRLLLRFGAVDYDCSVWVDGSYIGGHRGGHVPFDLDVSDAFASAESTTGSTGTGKARLTLRVRDSPYDLAQTPRQTILGPDDIESGELHAQVSVLGRGARAACSVEIEASLYGKVVGNGKGKVKRSLKAERDWVGLDVCMKVSGSDVAILEKERKAPFDVEGCWYDGVAVWSPEHPILYDLTLRLYDEGGKVVDEVQTTTGMRSLSWQNGDGTFRLNGKPYFQMLFLDQGYWPETGLTPPSSEALKLDIQMSKDLGFNGCRKHQKVEDPRFHYWADRLGFIVWGEMANAYEFGPDYIDRMNSEWTEAVKRDINHPCIITWTPNNESWAYTSLKDNIEQRNHIRSLWKGGILAPKAGHDMFSRPIYSGFAGHTLLDPGAQHKAGAPVICTEFGGVNIAPGKGGQAGDRDWGYTTATDIEDFLKRYERLVMGIVKGGHTCGLVYTQLCDIEQEVNGLYSYDRKAKVPVARIKAIMDAAKEHYYDHVQTHGPRGIKKLLHSLHRS